MQSKFSGCMFTPFTSLIITPRELRALNLPDEFFWCFASSYVRPVTYQTNASHSSLIWSTVYQTMHIIWIDQIIQWDQGGSQYDFLIISKKVSYRFSLLAIWVHSFWHYPLCIGLIFDCLLVRTRHQCHSATNLHHLQNFWESEFRSLIPLLPLGYLSHCILYI